MPEGDTIYRSARALHKALAGKIVTGFETALAKLASRNDDAPVVGRVVEKVEAQGKWCLIHFSGDLILVTHMLMSGSWHIYRADERWRMPRRAMRVAITVRPVDGGWPGGVAGDADSSAALRNDKNAGSSAALQNDNVERNGSKEKPSVAAEAFTAVAFNVPVAEFHTARTLARYSQVPKLGVDVLGVAWSVEAGVAALEARKRSHPDDEIAVALLNQRVMAGLGNVYKSEVAFAAGVNPFRRMSTITAREMEVMADKSGQWLKANVNDGSNSSGVAGGDGIVTYSGNRRTTNNMDRSDRLWVYGRQGQECRRCGALVEMRKQGEQARSTYWCPRCQPWIAAEGQSAEEPHGRKMKLLGPRRRVGC